MAEPNVNNDDKPKLTRLGMELDKSMEKTRAAKLELVAAPAVGLELVVTLAAELELVAVDGRIILLHDRNEHRYRGRDIASSKFTGTTSGNCIDNGCERGIAAGCRGTYFTQPLVYDTNCRSAAGDQANQTRRTQAGESVRVVEDGQKRGIAIRGNAPADICYVNVAHGRDWTGSAAARPAAAMRMKARVNMVHERIMKGRNKKKGTCVPQGVPSRGSDRLC